ncbi:hypothetical protein [Rufibacter psychrotolerans]|uniref:hypothetical protein n=1 Tax=Rufibacter psychrotolerans TaxID=2812556 RepID=UPI001967A30A|nr:hypothetical protein [Rufibacter sp. SYSU D00308]
MADLTASEKQKLESLLKMKQGFLLDFTNASLHAFVFKSVGLDFNHEKYRKGTGSKASRMKELWRVEPNLIVAKLIFDLCQYHKDFVVSKAVCLKAEEHALFADCVSICKKLSYSAGVVAFYSREKSRVW